MVVLVKFSEKLPWQRRGWQCKQRWAESEKNGLKVWTIRVQEIFGQSGCNQGLYNDHDALPKGGEIQWDQIESYLHGGFNWTESSAETWTYICRGCACTTGIYVPPPKLHQWPVCVCSALCTVPLHFTHFLLTALHCNALDIQCIGYLQWPMHYPAVKWREQSPDPHFSLFDNTWLCKEGQSTRNFRQRPDVSTWCPFHIMPSSFVVTFSQFLWSAFILWNHLLLNWSGRRSVSRQLIGRHWYYSNHLREVRISVPGTRSRTPKQP